MSARRRTYAPRPTHGTPPGRSSFNIPRGGRYVRAVAPPIRAFRTVRTRRSCMSRYSSMAAPHLPDPRFMDEIRAMTIHTATVAENIDMPLNVMVVIDYLTDIVTSAHFDDCEWLNWVVFYWARLIDSQLLKAQIENALLDRFLESHSYLRSFTRSADYIRSRLNSLISKVWAPTQDWYNHFREEIGHILTSIILDKSKPFLLSLPITYHEAEVQFRELFPDDVPFSFDDLLT